MPAVFTRHVPELFALFPPRAAGHAGLRALHYQREQLGRAFQRRGAAAAAACRADRPAPAAAAAARQPTGEVSEVVADFMLIDAEYLTQSAAGSMQSRWVKRARPGIVSGKA